MSSQSSTGGPDRRRGAHLPPSSLTNVTATTAVTSTSESNANSKKRAAHRHPRNPFTERQRNNFPNWDDVFMDTTTTTATRASAGVATAARTGTGTGAGAEKRQQQSQRRQRRWTQQSSSSPVAASASAADVVVDDTNSNSSNRSGRHVDNDNSNSNSSSNNNKIDRENNEDDDVDSWCFSSQGGGSSILNMSIGARAALNEHLRHIHKYGIDGDNVVAAGRKGDDDDREITNNDLHGYDGDGHNGLAGANTNANANNSDSENDNEIPAPPSSTHSLDRHWETLLNASYQVNTSFGPGSSISNSQGVGAGSAGVGNLSSLSVPRYDFMYCSNENSIEVMTDVSNDFFNSSRVQELLTPERNKDRQVDVVVTRVHNNVSIVESSIEEEDDGDVEEASSSHSGGRILWNILNHSPPPTTSLPFLGQDTSFHSSFYGAVDLSRISSNFGSECRQTPLPSFDEEGHAQLDLDETAFSPIQSVASPLRVDSEPDSSFSSGPYRKMPAFTVGEAGSGMSSGSQQNEGSHEQTTRQHQQQSLPSGLIQRSPDQNLKDNISPGAGDKSSSSANSSSLHSTISSMIAEASSFVSYVAHEVELSMEAIESLPQDFFRAMHIGGTQNDADDSTPSPISPVGSSSSSQGARSKGTKPHYPPSSTTISVPNIHHRDARLSGRRHFRTVVPRRVYIGPSLSEEDEGETDVERGHGCILDVQSNPERTRSNRSLLESFEEAINRTF